MKITYPHIGDLSLAVEELFRRLDIDFIPPPPPGTAVLAAGAPHSPETVCLPYKHVLGEMILNLEKGADTVVLIGGRGPCRFGFYGDAGHDALRELGYDFAMVSTDNPDALRSLVEELRTLSPRNSRLRLAWEIYLVCRRVEALDRVQDRANRIRYRAEHRAALDRAVVRAKNEIARAHGLPGILMASRRARKILDGVPLRPAADRPLRVGIVGEFYSVVDPHTNFHVEQVLGDLGVEVHRGVWIGQWLNDRIRYRPLRRHDRKRAKRIAKPYMEFSPGGEAVVTIARVIDWHRAGFDGFIHLLPFTCMPEMISASILPTVTRDHPIPMLRVVIDEHTDGTGLRTRLEAFVDTLVQRRKREKGRAVTPSRG